ncbi:tetratricopeptide repeat protein [Bauldia sp.]|uniref:tetratricopeptide repeat protein n=1 Tax=Bauldia sp. TaxID=2575872 RepID=UPI003BAB8479
MNRQPARAPISKQTTEVLTLAAGHVGAGRLRAGIKALERHRPALSHPAGQNILGNAHLHAGRLDAALKAFDAALALAPQFAEAHCSRGVALQEQGRFDEALAAFDRALALKPAYPLAHYNRANVLQALRQYDKAVIAYDHAVQMEPRFGEAHLNRGVTLLAVGKPQPAVLAFDKALRARPGWSEALLGKATALARLHKPAETLAAADQVLAREPDNTEALSLRGDALTRLKRADEAEGAYREALELLSETDATALVRRATVYSAIGDPEAALAAADQAIAQSETAAAHMARAEALRHLGRLDDQLAAFDKAVTLEPPTATLHHGRGVVLGELGRLDEAETAFADAVALEPGNPRLRTDRALLMLHRGDYQAGWAEHEQRLRLPEFAFGGGKVQRWTGESIAGKSLLIHGEQGLGDTIQMLRYLPKVAESRAKLTLALPPALRRLIASSFTGLDIIKDDAVSEGFDFAVSLMSLPHLFDTRADTVPGPIPYLEAEPDLVAKWQQRIGTDGFRIGICWAGNPDHRADRYRSIPLAKFAPLAAVPGVRLISLQAMHGLDQLDALPEGVAVESLGPEVTDNPDGLAEIAAAMGALDVVISADTAVAHVAGALGRPVWTAIRYQPEWRWPEGKSEPPWYPTMWLFRQPAVGDWDSVFAEMAAYLAKHMGRG